MTHPNPLLKSPLHGTHVSLGARMVPFAGWEMPVQYDGIIDEVKAVRTRSGIFDVSHMGRVEVNGPGAADFLDKVLSFDVPALRAGRAKYGVVCDEDGGIIDDTILYRTADEGYLLVPNASNADAVVAWLRKWAPESPGVRIEVVTSRTAMMACQGPEAISALQSLSSADLEKVRPFRTVESRVAGVSARLARTGYTGEDGFEIIAPSASAPDIWGRLTERGLTPCGLGARDVLRLEAGLLLHGNDMDTSINPYEAGLDQFVDPDRAAYVAGSSLRRIRDQGVARGLVGFKMVGRGIARQGHPILDGESAVGHVSSGSYSPTLDTSIGLGYVPTAFAAVGSRFQVDIRGRVVPAEVVDLPFYSRENKG